MDKNITLQDLQASVEDLKQLCGQIVEKLEGKNLIDTRIKERRRPRGILFDQWSSQSIDTEPEL